MATQVKARKKLPAKRSPRKKPALPAPEVMAEVVEEIPSPISPQPSPLSEPVSSHGWTDAESDALQEAMGGVEGEARARAADAEPEHAGAIPIDAAGYIQRDAFPFVLGGFFHLGSAVSGLQTLKIEMADPAFEQAAYAVWDTCRETPYMDFVIRPGGKWMQRGGAILAFVLPIYFGCKTEIAARRAVASTGDGAPRAANDNEAPPSGMEAF